MINNDADEVWWKLTEQDQGSHWYIWRQGRMMASLDVATTNTNTNVEKENVVTAHMHTKS